jgi:hypothetical protein
LISWKHSFRNLSEEYDAAKRKKEALDNLLTTGKISEATHSLFNQEIGDVIAEIERQRMALLDRMTSKMKELETQIRTLEILLANFEIQHVTGEVDEEVYQRDTGLLSMGLETARGELESVKEATDKLSENDVASQSENEQITLETESSQPEVDDPGKAASTAEEKSSDASEETIVEMVQCSPEEPSTEESSTEVQTIDTEAEPEEELEV